MAQRASDCNREFIFTDRDFHVLRDLINHYTGISVSEAKRDLVYNRLTRRLRQLNLKSFSKYCKLLLEDVNGDEVVHFTNAVTTNLTSFFREPHHFEYLENRYLPTLSDNGFNGKRLRFWSAGCSTGEEAYSLAMCIKETLPARNNYDVKLLATDLDSTVMNTAINGVYQNDKLSNVSPYRRKKWFQNISSEKGSFSKVCPELQKLITFRQLNLMHDWPMKGPFDAIFCRNVVIYFDKPTQKILFERFADLLSDNGYLFLGHSESMFKVTDRFKLMGQTIYQKIR